MSELLRLGAARAGAVELDLLDDAADTLARTTARLLRGEDTGEALAVARPAWALFASRRVPRTRAPGPLPAVYREVGSGLIRAVHREVVVRFRPGTREDTRHRLLAARGLAARRTNPYVPDQVVARVRDRRDGGPAVVGLANRLLDEDDVVAATPNFASQYRRVGTHLTPVEASVHGWHLDVLRAPAAWAASRGAGVVVAVLDDGVDTAHPALGLVPGGRDFSLDDADAGHLDAGPKAFRSPYDRIADNDIHGTACAGLVASVAPDARLLPVKVFHAGFLARDERIADGIRFAATRAGVVSCSWSGPLSDDVALALADAGVLGRSGLGSPVVAAAGNDDADAVAFPACEPGAIAVGATTDAGELAYYSNRGDGLDLVAPSSGGTRGVRTTDVAIGGRGFDPLGDTTDRFGGTSAAAPMVAGVAALVIAAAPHLTRDEVREILVDTAAPVGRGGWSACFGHGLIDAEAAVNAALARTERLR